MTLQDTEETIDIFYLRTIYPDAKAAFAPGGKSLADIHDSCLVFLDASALLEPFEQESRGLLDQLRNTYAALIKQNRLVIPGQAAREWARHTAGKVAGLHQTINSLQINNPPKQKSNSVLSQYDQVKEVDEKRTETKVSKEAYDKAVTSLSVAVLNWARDDPLTELYAEIGLVDMIVDPDFDREEVQQDLFRRRIHQLPPGFRDAGKPDGGVGDLLIWYTVLKVAREKGMDALLVSQDQKNDWSVKVGGELVFPRPELAEEFRRETNGCSFHAATLGTFLRLVQADETVVKEVLEAEEEELAEAEQDERGTSSEAAGAVDVRQSWSPTTPSWLDREWAREQVQVERVNQALAGKAVGPPLNMTERFMFDSLLPTVRRNRALDEERRRRRSQ